MTAESSAALEPIRAVDSQDRIDDVLALPGHLRDALWRVESTRIPSFDDADGLVVCGMGGSAIGADIARFSIGDRLTRPMNTIRDYELPAWASPRTVILCSSYSGETEETLACFAAAEAVGAPRVVATTGGTLAQAAREAGVPIVGLPGILLPRFSIGYTLVVAAEVAAKAGAGPAIRTEIDAAAAHIERSMEALIARSVEVAEAIGDATPVIYGCDLTTPVAYRWKSQVNECVKRPAFHHYLPELNHNELAGWTDTSDPGRFCAVILTDSDQHPRERRRAELTAELIAPATASVSVIETEGETRTARALWAVVLGDLVALQLAARFNVDPAPIELIDSLKSKLSES